MLDGGRAIAAFVHGSYLQVQGLVAAARGCGVAEARGHPHSSWCCRGWRDRRSCASALAALDAEVINRWLDDKEIAPLLARYDAMALPYIEASQSGVAAVAFGSCMPVIAMPSGGLAEQVIEGRTGVIAGEVTARAFADAIRRVAVNPSMYAQVSRSLQDGAKGRSMGTFIERLLEDGALFNSSAATSRRTLRR